MAPSLLVSFQTCHRFSPFWHRSKQRRQQQPPQNKQHKQHQQQQPLLQLQQPLLQRQQPLLQLQLQNASLFRRHGGQWKSLSSRLLNAGATTISAPRPGRRAKGLAFQKSGARAYCWLRRSVARVSWNFASLTSGSGANSFGTRFGIQSSASLLSHGSSESASASPRTCAGVWLIARGTTIWCHIGITTM